LPHDVLVHIFSFLPRGALTVTPGRVCRAWAAAKAELWAALEPIMLESDAAATKELHDEYVEVDANEDTDDVPHSLAFLEKYQPYLPAWYVRQTFGADLRIADASVSWGALRHGQIDVVADLHAASPGCFDCCGMAGYACKIAAHGGQLSTLQWLCEHGYQLDKSAVNGAAEGGNTGVLAWLWERGCRSDESACEAAALCGRLDALIFLHEHGCPLGSSIRYAARGGHIPVLVWLRQNGVPWAPRTFDAAAKGGRISALAWLLEHGCPWRSLTCGWAADAGQLDALKFLRERGCPWCEETCCRAAYGNHMHVLTWAREHGCAWDADTTLCAAYGCSLAALKYSVANGCPINVYECLEALDRYHDDFPRCRDWLMALLPPEERASFEAPYWW
jgi:hypothetical protein